MKIVVIIDGLTRAGSEKQAVASTTELAKRGHDVSLLTWTADNHFREELDSTRVRLIRLDPCWGRIRRTFALWRILRDLHPDVVHCMKATPTFPGTVAGRLAGVPRVFGGYRGIARMPAMHRSVLRLVAQWTDGWIVNAAAVKPVVVQDFRAAPGRVHVIPNIAYTDSGQHAVSKSGAKTHFGLDPDTLIVTMVCNFHPWKNLPMFLRVAQRVAAVDDRIRFVSAGGCESDSLRREVHNKARELGLDNIVTFLGRCDEVPKLLAATDVAVLTSKGEGMPNFLLEASAAGLPCVTTNYGSPEEIVDDGRTGFIVPIDDDELMAERLLALLRDPILRQRMGAAARCRIQTHFSIQAVVDRLIEVYTHG